MAKFSVIKNDDGVRCILELFENENASIAKLQAQNRVYQLSKNEADDDIKYEIREEE